MYLLTICVSSLEKHLFKFAPHSKICLLLSSCNSSLWILDRSLVPLEHLFLIVHCPWLCGYSCIRQSRHLSCFMDWLCTDEPSHSAQLEIVGTSIKSFPPQGEAGGCHFCLLLFAGVSGVRGAMVRISSNHHLCSPPGNQTVPTSQEIQNGLDCCWLFGQPWRNWGGGHKNKLFSSLGAADNWQGFSIHSLCTGQGEGGRHLPARAAVSVFPQAANGDRAVRAPRLAR